jgi:hypothetical protein
MKKNLWKKLIFLGTIVNVAFAVVFVVLVEINIKINTFMSTLKKMN